jgi:hypothetical protein
MDRSLWLQNHQQPLCRLIKGETSDSSGNKLAKKKSKVVDLINP